MTRAPRTSENVENTKPAAVADAVPALDLGETHTNFVVPFAITKVEAIRRMTSIARRAGLDYDGLRSATQEVRKNLGLSRPRRPKRLPRLLARREVVAFFGAVDAGGNLRDQVMLRMLAYTGMRVAEVVAVEREDVDLEALTVKVVQGKGSKDRTTLIPASFRLALQAYMEHGPRCGALFLGRLGKPLSEGPTLRRPDPEFPERGRRRMGGPVAKRMAHPWATRFGPPPRSLETTPLSPEPEVGEHLAPPRLRCVVTSSVDLGGGSRDPAAESHPG